MNYLKINGKKIKISEETAEELKTKFFSETEKEKFEIKNRFTGNVLYSSNKTNYREVLEEAVENEADLIGADLRGANLGLAKLSGVDLRRADLRGVNLIEAELIEADLRETNLGEADLIGANLRDVDLRGANLRGADLEEVKFSGKCGNTEIKKSQLNDFLKALGIVLED